LFSGLEPSNEAFESEYLKCSSFKLSPSRSLIDWFSFSCSQSEAHLKSKGIRLQDVEGLLNIGPSHSDLISKILKKEKSLHKKYYVFYHGQKWQFRIVQDLLRLLSIRLGSYKARDFREFVFLRIPYDYLNEFEDVACFIRKNEKISDAEVDISERILSVNLFLFGNFGDPFCCSWNYFIDSLSCFGYAEDIRRLLQDVLHFFGLELRTSKLDRYLDKLIYLNDSICTQEGNLFQIFVPKFLVDELVYLSYSFGVPFSSSWRTYPFDRKEYGKVSSMLNHCCNYPTRISFDVLNALQGRILLNQRMLNPRSGVKVFRYTTVAEDKMIQYEKDLAAVVDGIVCDSLSVALN